MFLAVYLLATSGLVVYQQQMCHKLMRDVPPGVAHPYLSVCLPPFVFPLRSEINPETKFSGNIIEDDFDFGSTWTRKSKSKIFLRLSGLLSDSFPPRRLKLALSAFLHKLPIHILNSIPFRPIANHAIQPNCNITDNMIAAGCKIGRKAFFKLWMLLGQQYDGNQDKCLSPGV